MRNSIGIRIFISAFLVLILLFLICSDAKASQARLYGSELSCNIITDICQDESKFIWIGTGDGLNRYDGWNFMPFYHAEGDTLSLLNNFISDLFIDSNKRLWVGTNKGLQYYLPEINAFRRVYFPNGIEPFVNGVIELNSGEMWISTAGYGLFALNKKTMRIRALSEINKTYGISFLGKGIYQDSNNNVWVTLSDNWIAQFKRKGSRWVCSKYRIDGGTTYDYMEDSSGNLFTASSTVVCRWNPVVQKFIPIKSFVGELDARKLYRSKSGHVYVATRGQGILGINAVKNEAYKVNYLVNQLFMMDDPSVSVSALIEDADKNLWIGCFRKGLLVVPREESLFKFWRIDNEEYKSGDHVCSIQKAADGSVWAGTERGLLLKMDKDGHIRSTYYTPRGISSIFMDSNDLFWIGTNDAGLAIFDAHSGSFSYNSRYSGKLIKDIVEGKRKDVYFSVYGEGLLQYLSAEKRWNKISDNTSSEASVGLKNKWINCMISDSKGMIWLGHFRGIDCYDPASGHFIHLEGISDLNSVITSSLLEDKNGILWIGTNVGLFSYDRRAGKLVDYGKENALLNKVICGLGEGNNGDIWCSTFNGIYQLKVKTKTVIPFLTGNGLYDKGYSRGVYCQSSDKVIYFGGLGITSFHPASIHSPKFEREPLLSQICLNNQPISSERLGKMLKGLKPEGNQRLNFSYLENSFSLDFSMMDFHNCDNVCFEYRMTKVDKDWVRTPLGSNRVQYNRLPPGHYLLEIRASESGAYSPIKKLMIVVSPPWYLSLPAKSLYLLLILLFVYFILLFQRNRAREKQKNELNEEKMKFLVDVTQEIRSPMSLIMSPLSILMNKNVDEDTKRTFHSMYLNANRIVTMLNQLLDIRRIDTKQMRLTFSEVDLVQFTRQLLTSYWIEANKKSINLLFETQVTNLPVWIDCNNFDKVLVNLLDNAFKVTPKGEDIKVHLVLDSGYVELLIVDSGSGLNESFTEKMFQRFYQEKQTVAFASGIGLNLCGMIMKLHGGTITASNRSDTHGGIFSLRLPLGRNHLNEDQISILDSNARLTLKRSEILSPIVKEKEQSSKSRTRYKVLLIGNEDETLLYLQQELSLEYKVFLCRNEADGLKMALQYSPDLVILDVMMPGKDGLDILRSLKNNLNISHIPIVLLTSWVEFDERMQGWDKGADVILTKPFYLEELMLLCSNLISNRLRLKGKFGGLQDQKDKVTTVELKSNDEKLMDRLMSVISNHMDDSSFTIENLATEVGLSRAQLHRRLKELMGVSTSEFVKNIRLKHAAELLQSKKLNISQVAYTVGYSNPALFSIAFKKYFGVSPTEYMKENNNNL